MSDYSRLEVESCRLRNRQDENEIPRQTNLVSPIAANELKRAVFFDGLGEAAQVFLAGNRDTSQLGGNWGQHLDIEQSKPSFTQALHEVKQGRFGGIAGAVKHGLAGKEPP